MFAHFLHSFWGSLICWMHKVSRTSFWYWFACAKAAGVLLFFYIPSFGIGLDLNREIRTGKKLLYFVDLIRFVCVPNNILFSVSQQQGNHYIWKVWGMWWVYWTGCHWKWLKKYKMFLMRWEWLTWLCSESGSHVSPGQTGCSGSVACTHKSSQSLY